MSTVLIGSTRSIPWRLGRRLPVVPLWLMLLCSTLPLPMGAQVHVLTQHNDNARTGATLHESTLNATNVNVAQFGKLFTRAVDGQIYAQPLYVSGLTIPGKGVHNVVFVATEHNSLYAFDADDALASEPLWHVNFGFSAPSPNPYFGNRYAPTVNIKPEFGITSTPVIDLASGTLYVVAFIQDNDGGPYHQLLHAIDITTGQDRSNSPLELAASVPGTGYGQDLVDGIRDRLNGQLIFHPMQYIQRSGLLLDSGVLYIAFCSHADTDPYHGWVLAVNALTLQSEGAFCVTPGGNEGGIWQSGQGLLGDGLGNVYCMTGNGTYGNGNYGDSFVKLHFNNGSLDIVDWFTPFNQATLEAQDADLGSAGPMLIPNTNLLIGGGKEGKFYLLNRNNMGQYSPANDNQAVQSFPATAGHIHGSPIYWNSPNGPLVYVWSEYDYLKGFRLTNGLFETTPYVQGAVRVPDGMPGGFLSVSSDGTKAGTGIVWAAHSFSGDAVHEAVPGMFRAFNATTLAELWNSKQNAARDDVGLMAKFCPPTVANGKVYLATFSNQLAVYGLGNWLATPIIAPNGGAFYPSLAVTLTDATPGVEIRYTTDGSDPVVTSPLYSGSVVLSYTATLKARAFKTGTVPSSVASADFYLVAPGSVVSINFVGGSADGGNPALMGSAEVAGVIAKPWWNNGTTRQGSVFTLRNDLGTVIVGSINWLCDNIWSTRIADTPGNNRMMKGYLDTGNVNPTTVQVSGLVAPFTTNGYDVFVYVDGGVTGATRTGMYTLGSTTLSLTDPGGVDFSGTFTQANNGVGNFLVLPGGKGASFKLIGTPGPADDNVKRAPLNALQIVAHPTLRTVSGKVTLEECLQPKQPVTFTFRPTGSPAFAHTVTLAGDGSFTVKDIPAANYKLAMKGSKWLQKVIAITLTNANATGVNATLLAGDVNNDNQVNLDDLGLLSDAFDTVPGDALWNAQTDLNCDGVVGLDDLGLLALNFDLSGDP